MRIYPFVITLTVSLALSGCASYTPAPPLPKHASSANALSLLTMPAAAFKTPGVRVLHLNPRRPLDANAVAALAVLNDPDLSAARARRGIATAQSYAAGLLPWPQLALGTGRARPVSSGLSNTWALALTQNIAGLVQHRSGQAAARAVDEKVRLDVIWDEWQVAQRARLVYADMEMVSAERTAVKPLALLYEQQIAATRAALQRHDISQSASVRVQAARAALVARLGALGIRYDKDSAVLHRLLGLAPGAPLSLALNDHPSLPVEKSVRAAIAALPKRRPDLMAIAAAYRSADGRLRQAVLAQFPLIGIAVRRQRDTEGTVENGLSLTFDLPFLNDARGAVAVANASRTALHANYKARLEDAVSDAKTMRDETRRLRILLTALHGAFSNLPETVDNRALGRVGFDALSAYVKERMHIALNIARLQRSADRATIALDTLLGMPLDIGSSGDGDPV